MKPLTFHKQQLKYTGLIGTGGIGSGKFFQLNGEHTLGREESRSGHFFDIEDYCKQHIILHYVKVLLGDPFHVIPIGSVGEDDTGYRLYHEMKATGFSMDHVQKKAGAATLFSFCFYYPDGSGGNLTTDNSASAQVSVGDIDNALPEIKALGKKGLAMAAPEVPLASRKALLALGREHGLFCAASFTSEELKQMDASVFADVDLLAINMDEARALARKEETTRDEEVVEHVTATLQRYHDRMLISVTGGRAGSWCWDGARWHHAPCLSVDVKSTAGAGDAFFSGLLCGLALNLPLPEAQCLATLLAGMSVTSPHTIHKGIDRVSLRTFATETGFALTTSIQNLLND
ncbi:Sugar or nucleoside kinase, ribokinase family [Chryseolinea serpens]|uniref:Sugar or nucleoside kinase, ribokinase family n=1 Tax=Chryseolinea serpens TaxID=947013 RepID=A0A1M5JK91_9BACT|nr:carbohydrate kinase family protein [Chryseolinea serpens]SHG41006.1 Sugar or nucleoside kinase, ribokinase family [Chryseolinea serpens]